MTTVFLVFKEPYLSIEHNFDITRKQFVFLVLENWNIAPGVQAFMTSHYCAFTTFANIYDKVFLQK